MDKGRRYEHGRGRRNRSRSPEQSSHRSHKDRSDLARHQPNKADSVQSFSVDLNKLRAKVMKARLTKSAELPELERQLAAAMEGDRSVATGSSSGRKDAGNSSGGVVVLPRVDSHGRLLKIGATPESKHQSTSALTKKEKARISESKAESLSIAQMARMERETEGDNAMDRSLAAQIMKDAKFTNDLEYIDDNAERLSKQRPGQSSEQLKQAAIRDYRVMESVLGHCDMCFKQSERADGSSVLAPPEYPTVALGNRVYLALPNREPMCDGHCIITPVEHVAGSSLKCDDDAWDEITNFMKCLMHMFAAKGQGVVFLETVMSTAPSKAQHCTIECIPMPLAKSGDAPAYFKEGLLAADDEWSQHRKIIDTNVRTLAVAPANDDVRDQDANHEQKREAIRRGGFRNTMSAKMPYFHVWFNPHGGMGHVIENADRFQSWFGREVVAGILDLPPTVYRKPRRLKESHNQRCDRAEEWKKQFGWDAFDWTKALAD
ncbi:Pre-mRNA-splicing factor cwf19 [Coemansia sp. IMI 209128]|nr:Pre-mRNA-splicing factor cwf19 [Coemansia sp. RSA 2530]KAJ2698012.1 Pre-mRNA-splicing factor cwf19 [Coemansia sp. IMI 209128]